MLAAQCHRWHRRASQQPLGSKQSLLPAAPSHAVDKFGRKFLFIEGGIQMAAALVRAAAGMPARASWRLRRRSLCCSAVAAANPTNPIAPLQIITGVVLAVEFPKCECCLF